MRFHDASRPLGMETDKLGVGLGPRLLEVWD